MDSLTNTNQIRSPDMPYFVNDAKKGKYTAKRALTADQIIKAAKYLLDERFKPGQPFNRPDIGREWLRLQYQNLEHEVFACLFLNNQNHLIAHEVLFKGTLDAAAVYPREVAKRALQLNAASVIFAHNHPSGINKPSVSDLSITRRLKDALALLDIKVLDHFIVAKQGAYSLAEHGQI